ncbi:hypothetical protein [Saccharothrix yanglingensis]|nr:hypothetical protein [Saccharothrix yanglingensis]
MQGVRSSTVKAIAVIMFRTDQDLLDGWLQTEQRRGERRRSQDPYVHLGLRFAFYGRMSTSERQDRRTSRLWQLEMSGLLVEGRRRLVRGHGRDRNRMDAPSLLHAFSLSS